MSTLTPLDYANYDFDTLTQQLVDRLKADPTSPWKDTYRSSTGQMLIELYAFIANLVLYYIERRAEESYIETAQLKSSVVNLVRLVGYIPTRSVSAVGQLQFSKNVAWAFDITIPQYTECRTNSGMKYLTNEQKIISAGLNPGDPVLVQGIQGSFVQVTFSSNGATSPAQVYAINDTQIENASFPNINDPRTTLGVFVNGTQWHRVSSFTSSTSDSQHYMIRAELDDTVSILFGNNQFGKAPALGDQIIVKYIHSDGASGNVFEAGKIISIFSPIYDSNNTLVTDKVSVTNPSPNGLFVGGDDAETIDEIRENAPNVFRTGDRAVTKSDYIAILENIPGIANANVWGEAEENPPNYNMFNRVKIVTIFPNFTEPTQNFKDTVISPALTAKATLTVKFEYTSPKVIEVVPTATVRIHQGYTISSAQQNINTVLQNNFVLGTTTRLGQSIRVSQIIKEINNLAEVSYLHMSLIVRSENLANFDAHHDFGGILLANPILPGSVNVYVGQSDDVAVLVGTDDGAGSFTPVLPNPLPLGFQFLGGEVQYNLGPNPPGYFGLDMLNHVLPPGNFIWVKYEQDNAGTGFDGDILVDKDEVCRLWNNQGDLTIDFE